MLESEEIVGGRVVLCLGRRLDVRPPLGRMDCLGVVRWREGVRCQYSGGPCS